MLGRLLSAFGVAAIKNEIAAAANRLKLRAILTAAAVVLWLLAIGFALGALTTWLATLVGPIAAAAILAGFFAVGAIGVQVAMIVIQRRRTVTPFSKVLANAIAPLKAAAEEVPPGEPDEADPMAHEETRSPAIVLALAAMGYALGRYVSRR